MSKENAMEIVDGQVSEEFSPSQAVGGLADDPYQDNDSTPAESTEAEVEAAPAETEQVEATEEPEATPEPTFDEETDRANGIDTSSEEYRNFHRHWTKRRQELDAEKQELREKLARIEGKLEAKEGVSNDETDANSGVAVRWSDDDIAIAAKAIAADEDPERQIAELRKQFRADINYAIQDIQAQTAAAQEKQAKATQETLTKQYREILKDEPNAEYLVGALEVAARERPDLAYSKPADLVAYAKDKLGLSKKEPEASPVNPRNIVRRPTPTTSEAKPKERKFKSYDDAARQIADQLGIT